MFIKILIVAVVLIVLAVLGLMLGLLMKKNAQVPTRSCGQFPGSVGHASGCCCMDHCVGSTE